MFEFGQLICVCIVYCQELKNQKSLNYSSENLEKTLSKERKKNVIKKTKIKKENEKTLLKS